ncbi:MAG: zinc ribbon domain-containing protein [Alistipes sp.]|nr:zinc ribbon domain-containing protein [Alistipes sp.]
MKCSNCNFENPDGAKFCQECGRELKTTVTCPKCHAEYEQSAKFCQQCGTSLTGATATEQVTPSVVPQPEPTPAPAPAPAPAPVPVPEPKPQTRAHITQNNAWGRFLLLFLGIWAGTVLLILIIAWILGGF